MDSYSIIKTIGALLLVLAMMVVFALVLRRFGNALPGLTAMTRSKEKRLAVLETSMIDSRHRLALISRDGVEHLLVLSVDKATVVETSIVRSELS